MTRVAVAGLVSKEVAAETVLMAGLVKPVRALERESEAAGTAESVVPVGAVVLAVAAVAAVVLVERLSPVSQHEGRLVQRQAPP